MPRNLPRSHLPERSEALASGMRRASAIASIAVYGLPLSELDDDMLKVQTVTAGQVQAFAKAQLDPAQATVVVAGDAKAFAKGLKARLPNLEIISSAELDLDEPSLRKPAK